MRMYRRVIILLMLMATAALVSGCATDFDPNNQKVGPHVGLTIPLPFFPLIGIGIGT